MVRVVVTLTTIPTREDSVIKTIESIQAGTYKVNEIYVNLPEWYPRFGRGPDPNLETKLVSMGVKVNTCKDYGSLTKLVPILDIETDPETLIVVLDDDVTYNKRVVEGLVRANEQFKCPVGYSGIAYPDTAIKHLGHNGFILFQGHGQKTEILECAFGVLFPRKCLDGFPVPEPMTPDSDKYMYLTDDFIFSKFFDSKGIEKKIACYPWAGRRGEDWSTIWTQNEGSQTHSLSRDGNLENYLKASLKLKFSNMSMFHPWNVGLEKVRIGNLDGDGGYVVLDSNFGSKYILGYGVDRDVSFENELTEKYGMKGFVFDHTIQDVPNVSSNVTYLPEGIGSSVAPPLFTLENHVSRFVPDGESFMLKMDVEGCEWDVLRTADLSRVTQLIIEFHDLQAAPLEVVSKLNETFYLAHIHGNNCHNQPWVQIDRVHKMPRYLECTYVRKDLVSGATLDFGDFPVPQDIKCRPDAPELELDFWKPCTDPVIFVAPDANQVNILERLVTKEDRIVSRVEDAEGPLVFVLEKNDIVPVNVIMSLDNIRKQGSVQFPVLKNGYMESYEVRFINKLVPTLLGCPEPIINLKKFLL